jgi:hypothetical protein
MRRHFLAALLIALLQRGAPQEPPADPNLRGTIRGVVRLVGEEIPASGIDFYVIQLGAARQIAGKTGPDGRFELRDLPAGRYQGHVDKEGFLTRNGGLPIVGVVVTLSADSPAGEMVMTAVKGTIVSGKVTDEGGQPVAGIAVTPLLVGYREGQAALTPRRATTAGRALAADAMTTDDRGEYRIAWLGSGEYYIRAGGTEPGGRGAARTFGGRGTAVAPAVSRVGYFPAATNLQNATRITLRPGQELSGVNIRMPSARGITVSGKVINAVPVVAAAGRGARGAAQRRIETFYLMRKGGLNDDGLEPTRINSTGWDEATNETQFQIPNVMPGSYELFSVFQDGAAAQRLMHFARTAIEVKDTDVKDVVATIRPNSPVSGRLAWAAAPVSLTGTNLQIRLRDEDLPAAFPIAGRAAISVTEGAFLVPSVGEARYKVLVQGLPGIVYVSDIRWGSASIYDNPKIEVTSQENRRLDVDLKSDGGTVKGFVRNARGEAVLARDVFAIPQGARRENPNLYRWASTALDGSFTLQGLAPGDYKIFAWETVPQGNPEEVPDFVSRYETQGRLVNVKGGTTTDGIQVPLIPWNGL